MPQFDTTGAIVLHDTAWYFDDAWYVADIQLWMTYPASLKKVLLQDAVTSTLGDICEDFEAFENSFGALWNLFRRKSTFRNLFQTEFALPTKKVGLSTLLVDLKFP